MALVWCAPALREGWVSGSYDLVLRFGLGQGIFGSVHNILAGDTARQSAVWMNLDWRAVHAMRLPLWNPFEVLGLPELSNFQSAAGSLPSVAGYLAPLPIAYTVAVLAKLVIGGTGCYFASRVLGVTRSGALLAGVVGELAGPAAAWSGWPQAGVAAWTGWLLGCVVLVLRAPRWSRVAGLAVVVAWMCAGGFPEVLVLVGITGVIVAGVIVVAGLPGGGARRQVLAAGKAFGALGVSTLLGGLLSAPLWLPSLPVLARSVSATRPPPPVLPAGEPWLLLDPTYWGLPTRSGTWFGPWNYYETAAFVGPIVCCLVVVALVRRWRDRRIVALAVAGVVLVLLGFGLPPLASIVRDVPGLRSVAFSRGLLVLCYLFAILSAVGLDEARRGGRGVLASAWGAVAVASGLTVVATIRTSALDAQEKALRLDGAWIAWVGLGALAILFGPRALRRTRRPFGQRGWAAVGCSLAAVEALCLVLATTEVGTWAHRYLPENPAISRLVAATHGGLVAIGGGHGPGQSTRLGITADLNAAYGVRELAGYDAVMPRALDRLWVGLSQAPDLARHQLAVDVTTFVPNVTTVKEARALGASYVLEPHRLPVRLVDGAALGVARILHRSGLFGRAVETGVVDDLEWLTEEPGLLHDYPVHRAGTLLDYFAALARPGSGAAPPAPLGVLAATSLAPILARTPAVAGALQAQLTDKAPTGTFKVATIGNESLYAVPGPSGARFDTGGGHVDTSLTYLAGGAARVVVTARHPSWVELAIDDEPGWTATARGVHLAVVPAEGGATLAVRVPAGRSVVVLSYWPKYLSASLLATLVALAVLAIGWALSRRRRREASSEGPGGGSADLVEASSEEPGTTKVGLEPPRSPPRPVTVA